MNLYLLNKIIQIVTIIFSIWFILCAATLLIIRVTHHNLLKELKVKNEAKSYFTKHKIKINESFFRTFDKRMKFMKDMRIGVILLLLSYLIYALFIVVSFFIFAAKKFENINIKMLLCVVIILSSFVTI